MALSIFCIRWACPGVPLEKLMPAWIPGRLLIGYLTGAILLVAGACILLAKKTRMAATYLGTWIVLLVVVHLWADPDRVAGRPEHCGQG